MYLEAPTVDKSNAHCSAASDACNEMALVASRIYTIYIALCPLNAYR